VIADDPASPRRPGVPNPPIQHKLREAAYCGVALRLLCDGSVLRLLGCFEYIKKKALEDEFELPGDGEAARMAPGVTVVPAVVRLFEWRKSKCERTD